MESKASQNSPKTDSAKKSRPQPKQEKNNHKYIFIAAAAALLIILVSVFVFNQIKVNKFNEKNQALLAQNQMQDSLLNDFMTTFNEFENNLEKIKEREGLISVNAQNPELRKSGSDKINDDLMSIDQLLQRNREIIEQLTVKVNDAEIRNKPLRRTVAKLTKKLKEKEGEISTLTGQLTALNIRVDTLNFRVVELTDLTQILNEENTQLTARIGEQDEQISLQDEEINQQTEKLNTAYYIAATAKELKQKNIIIRGKKLNRDFDRSAFTKVDITELSSIPIHSKKARVLTYHPSSSYALNNTDEDKKLDEIEIKDPESFWKSSKYLVVVLN